MLDSWLAFPLLTALGVIIILAALFVRTDTH